VLNDLRGSMVRRSISMILYFVVYVLVLIVHIFVSILSDTADKRGTAGDNNRYNEMMGLNVTICIITLICWCILMQSTTSNFNFDIDRIFSSVTTNLFEEDLEDEVN